MRRIDYTIPPEYDGRKVLHFLRGSAGCSYSLVRSLKTFEDGILLNGVRTRTIDRVKEGDRLTITLHENPKEAQLFDSPVPVLYEDDDLIVFDKPAKMACHPAKSMQQGTLANVFAAHCARIGAAAPCRILNRMDKDTTGAVVIAKNAFAAAALTGKIDNTYLAVIPGVISPPSGVVDAPIGQPDRTDPRRAVLPDGKPARTGYETVFAGEWFSILRCTLYTGRTHQIRVHMAHLGHPLFDDTLYEGDLSEIGRQALHCAAVSFTHPVTGKAVRVESPLPKDMQKFEGQPVESC